MTRRRRPLLILSAALVAPSACSLVTNVDDFLCPEDDPNCADAAGSGGLGMGGGDGGGDNTGGGNGDGDSTGGTGGTPSTGGMGGSGMGGMPVDDDCPASGQLVLEYQNGEATTSIDRFRPHFQVHNQSTMPVSFSDLEIRYYFTEDAGGTPSYQCTFVFGLNPDDGCEDALHSSIEAFSGENTNSYLSLTFPNDAPIIDPNRRSLEIKGQVRLSGDDLFDQGNDYSFSNDIAYTEDDYAAWDRVTLYCNGRLIWGTEPE